jgi:hypothetical protein
MSGHNFEYTPEIKLRKDIFLKFNNGPIFGQLLMPHTIRIVICFYKSIATFLILMITQNEVYDKTIYARGHGSVMLNI